MEQLDKILLCARYMGIQPIESKNSSGEPYYYWNNPDNQDFEALPSYDSDWNALMDVVAKLNVDPNYKVEETIMPMPHPLLFSLGNILLKADIDAAFEYVVSCIEKLTVTSQKNNHQSTDSIPLYVTANFQS